MHLRRFLTLAILAFGGSFAFGDDKADVKAVIDKAVNAHGGEANLSKAKITRFKAKGTLSIGGMELEFTATNIMQLPDKFRSEIKIEAMGQTVEIVRTYNGSKGWLQARGNTMAMEGEQLEDAKNSALQNAFEAILPLAQEKDAEFTKLPEEKVDGKPAVGLKIMKKGYKEYRMYFDKESGLLVKTWSKGKDMQAQEVVNEAYFSNYKEVNGTKVAMKQEVKQDGNPHITAQLTDVKYEDKIDAATFEKP